MRISSVAVVLLLATDPQFIYCVGNENNSYGRSDESHDNQEYDTKLSTVFFGDEQDEIIEESSKIRQLRIGGRVRNSAKATSTSNAKLLRMERMKADSAREKAREKAEAAAKTLKNKVTDGVSDGKDVVSDVKKIASDAITSVADSGIGKGLDDATKISVAEVGVTKAARQKAQDSKSAESVIEKAKEKALNATQTVRDKTAIVRGEEGGGNSEVNKGDSWTYAAGAVGIVGGGILAAAGLAAAAALAGFASVTAYRIWLDESNDGAQPTPSPTTKSPTPSPTIPPV